MYFSDLNGHLGRHLEFLQTFYYYILRIWTVSDYKPNHQTIYQNYKPIHQTIYQNYKHIHQTIYQNYKPMHQTISQNCKPIHQTIYQNFKSIHQTITILNTNVLFGVNKVWHLWTPISTDVIY